ncbi:hypothetical protein MA16_Dca001572 [Dendrobium catenatum]|uniref:Uncharacterized protein n=1 Tax=Dendrobium catenatum TaxID=906689 RepID=A0A2I0WMT9_9ASPA|nr:hypothetical protein MA16_Dca001572 [Dendrobium catenatum]
MEQNPADGTSNSLQVGNKNDQDVLKYDKNSFKALVDPEEGELLETTTDVILEEEDVVNEVNSVLENEADNKDKEASTADHTLKSKLRIAIQAAPREEDRCPSCSGRRLCSPRCFQASKLLLGRFWGLPLLFGSFQQPSNRHKLAGVKEERGRNILPQQMPHQPKSGQNQGLWIEPRGRRLREIRLTGKASF